MVISQLTLAKFQQFFTLFSELMHEGYGGFSPKLQDYFLSHDYSYTTYYTWLERGFRRFYIAEEGSETIGFLIGDNTYGGVGFVSWIGVKPEWRTHGVGKALLAEYEKFARAKRAHLLELFTYDQVKPFYEKLGFAEIGRRLQGFYGQKNIIMNKKLGDWQESYIELREL